MFEGLGSSFVEVCGSFLVKCFIKVGGVFVMRVDV